MSIVAPEVITGVFLIALVAQISSIAATEVITAAFLIAFGDRDIVNRPY